MCSGDHGLSRIDGRQGKSDLEAEEGQPAQKV